MTAPVIAIVTGSRDWTDEATIRRALEALPSGSTVMHGACPTGADAIANRVAADLRLSISQFPAKWKKYGKGAGPIRNRSIVYHARCDSRDWAMPVVCLAFPLPSSIGTLDMMRLCEVEGWEVRRFAPATPPSP